jgi:DNA helicase-2/ATP-dependent DNA helicase PcrA
MSAPKPGSINPDAFLAAYERAIGTSLNPAQRDAVLHDSGPLFVMAGPGSGKSEVMVARALKLFLVDGVPSGSIRRTTFTETAARNLEDRIADRLLAMGYNTTLDDLRVGTLHSLCDEIMREARYADYYDVRLLSDAEQSFFVYAHCDWIDQAPPGFWTRFPFLHPRASRKYGPNKWQKTQTLRTLFNRVTEEEVDLDRLAKSKDKCLVELAHVTASYRRLLKEKHRSDFAQLQLQFKQFLGTKVGQKFLSGDPARSIPGVSHVLVDEYQDTNPIQETIYFALAKAAGGNITVVGDDDQALYRFRGGTVECLVRFPDKCARVLGKEARPIQLSGNYRSLPEITKWAEGVIGSQRAMRKPGARTPKKPMVNARESIRELATVYQIQGSDYVDAGQRVASVIEELLKSGLVSEPSHIAILLRSSKESPQNAGPVAAALRERGLRVYNPRSKAFLEAEEVAGMLGALLETLDRGSHIGGTLKGFMTDSIAEWRAAYVGLAKKYPELRAYVSSVHAELGKRTAAEWLPVTVRDVFFRLLSRQPFSSWQEDPNRTYRLGQLSAMLESFASVEESDVLRVSSEEHGRLSQGWLRGRFYPRLIGYLHQAEVDDPEDVDYQIVPGAIQIMTIHQAKGLEFPVVFVDSLRAKASGDDAAYELEDLLVPFSQNPRKLVAREDRATQDLARLFYVAYTRAKNALCLFGPATTFRDATVAVGREA